jgi:hypothetical protein
VAIASDTVAAIIRNNAKVYNANAKPDELNKKLTRGLKGAVVGILDQSVGEFHRKLILAYIFRLGEKLEPISSKALDDGQWMALVNWVEPFKDEVTLKWRSGRKSFSDEIDGILSDALVEFHTKITHEERALFGTYDAASLLASAVSLGGEIKEVYPHKEEHDDVVVPPAKLPKKKKDYGNYLDSILFDKDDDLGDVNF